MLFGLLLSGGLYAAFSPATAHEAKTDAELVQEGRELFLVGCSFCHGQNGEGVLSADGESQLGPSLVGVGAAAVDFQVGTGRMPASQPGAQFAPKEVVFDEEEIEALAAYVASLGPGPAIPNESDYSLSDSLTDQEKEEAVTQGMQIFLTNCTACHNFAGAGGAMPRGKVAKALRDTDPRYIYDAMLTGPGEMDKFSDGNLSPEEKRDVIAYIQQLDDTPEYGGFGMGGVGPVSEGMFVWLVGMGALVGFAYWIASHTARTDKDKVEA